MSLTATVTPGKTFVAAELVTNSKLNQLAAPSVTLSGTADTGEITNNSVTAVKAAYGPWFYCTDGGTANAHSLTAAASATTLPTTLVAGQIFRYTVNANNSGAVTVAISGIGGTVPLTRAGTVALVGADLTAGQAVEILYDGTQFQLINTFAPEARTAVPVRQTVLSCSVASTGLPNYVSFSGQNISFQNCDTTSLIIAFAASYDSAGAVDYVSVVSTNTSNVWTISVSDATYYLYADRNTSTGAITYGSVATLRPNYTNSSTISTTTDQHTFNINTMRMSVGIAGPSSSVVQRVFLGECVVSGGVLQTPTLYMPRGQFQSGTDQTLGTNGTTYTFFSETHRLGLAPSVASWVLVCIAPDTSYVAGDEVDVLNIVKSNGARNAQSASCINTTTLTLSLDWITYGAAYLVDVNSSPFLPSRIVITDTKWQLRAYAKRGW